METEASPDRINLSTAEVKEKFAALRRVSPSVAMEWLYEYALNTGIITSPRKSVVAEYCDRYIPIVIRVCDCTPHDAPISDDGACAVPVVLGGEKWLWKFSSRSASPKSGIAVCPERRRRSADMAALQRLCDFADAFPSFYISAQAGLPGLGETVLDEEHFHGGDEVMPLFTAPPAYVLVHPDFPGVIAEVPEWFCSAVRLTSVSRDALSGAVDAVRTFWEKYTDLDGNIIAADSRGKHNAASLTVRRCARGYECHMILRSNVATDAFPDGVFGRRADFGAIAPEQIGVTEALGLFVLPRKTYDDLEEITELLIKGEDLPQDKKEYRYFFEECRRRGQKGGFTKAMAQDAVRFTLIDVCKNALADCAVTETPYLTARLLMNIGFKFSE